jgi:hypothetical protein
VLRGVCAGSRWVAMARIETSRATFVGDIASPSCGTLLRKDKPHLVLRRNGDCGKFTQQEMAQRELGENPTFEAVRFHLSG